MYIHAIVASIHAMGVLEASGKGTPIAKGRRLGRRATHIGIQRTRKEA